MILADGHADAVVGSGGGWGDGDDCGDGWGGGELGDGNDWPYDSLMHIVVDFGVGGVYND